MTEIYLVRHTEAEGNLYKMMQGHWDGNVTPLGRREVAALAERFRNIHIDAVYSSDLFRSVITATALAGEGQEIIEDKRLREINVGPWEGEFFGNLMQNEPESLQVFMKDMASWHIDGAETFDEVRERMVAAVSEIAGKHKGQTIGITSHGVAILCFMAKVLEKGYNDIPVPRNTAVTKLRFDGEKFFVDYYDDSSHLEDLGVGRWVPNQGLRDEELNPKTDRELYCSCYEDAWKLAHNGSTEGFRADDYFRQAVQHQRVDSRAVLKLYDGDKFAGIVDLDTERGRNEGYGWVSFLYLKPEFRGKRLGPQLLARAYMHYEKLGRQSVRLCVNENNGPAIEFYERYGFIHIDSMKSGPGEVLVMDRNLKGDRNLSSEKLV